MRKCLLIIALLLACMQPCTLHAQNYALRLQAAEGDSLALMHLGKVPTTFSSATALLSYLQSLPSTLQEAGFLTASIDDIKPGDSQYDAVVYVGKMYKWGKLRMDGIPAALLLDANIDSRQWTDQPLRPARFARLTSSLLSWADNNGYPFASVYLDSITIPESGVIAASLKINTGELRKIDSIVVEGDVNINPSFLYRYLELTPGMLYSEEKLNSISPRLKELLYLQEEKPWEINFRKFDTHLRLYLKERPANQLNAIVGLQPNTAATTKFLLTVDVQVALQNILGYGEAFSFSVQQLQARSPRIKLDGLWPYLLGTSFGAEGHFNLYKQDLLFQKVSLQAGTRYALNARSYLRVYYDRHSNNVSNIDTQYIRNFRQLPDNNGSKSSGIGTEINITNTDYRMNPRRGWAIQVNGSFLRRTITKNDAVLRLQDGSGFDFATLYDSLNERSNQYQGIAVLEGYLPLGKRGTFKTAYHAGYISGAKLFLSELFQIGGFKLLRGFDEQSIFASQYHLLTLEPRLLLDQNSYVFVYSDNAWVQSNFNVEKQEGFYFGFGAGATLQTKTGQFTIGYGLGKRPNAQIRLRESKIYLGYIAYF